jgi:integrase
VDFVTQNGKRIRHSAKTADKKQAQEYHDRLKAQHWRIDVLDDKPDYTWKDAVVYWAESRKSNPSFYNDTLEIKRLDKYLGKLTLKQIKTETIERIKRLRMKDGVSPRTVNATLQCIRSVMRTAKDLDWIDNLPSFKLLPEPKRRIRFLTEEEEARLLAVLPQHVKQMVKFSLSTGLRKANVTGLTWSQIDINRKCAWIHPDQAKAGNAIPVPLNQESLAIIREQIGKHLTHVFTYHGNPIEEPARYWSKWTKQAKVENFRWHDLRHTWASRLIQNGVPLHALMELGGWQDIDMVRKYAHFSSSHLLEYAELSRSKKEVNGTVMAQSNLEQKESGYKTA